MSYTKYVCDELNIEEEKNRSKYIFDADSIKESSDKWRIARRALQLNRSPIICNPDRNEKGINKCIQQGQKELYPDEIK